MTRRVRRLWELMAAMLRVGFADAVAYRSEFVVWMLTTNMPLIMLVLWSSVAAEAPFGRFDQRRFVAYFLVAFVVRLLTSAWIVWDVNSDIRTGALSMRLLRPVPPYVNYATENLAAWPLRLACCLPVVVVLFAVDGRSSLSQDWRQWLMFPITVAGGWAITFTTGLLIGSLAFFWQSSMNVMHLWMSLYFVFSGYVIPLELFPPALRRAVDFLPFRYVIGLPIETALGLVGARESAVYILGQLGFVAFFGVLALTVWRAGLRRYEAFGG